MKYNIKQNWVNTAAFMLKKPIAIQPFIIIAFIEFLALEFVYFSARKPLSVFAGPLVKKFFGENFLHYPGNILISSQLFYYADLIIYTVLSLALMSISVNILMNVKSGLPVRMGAMIKNAMKKYFSFVLLGIIIIALMILVEKADAFVLKKISRLASKFLHQKVGADIFLFLTPLTIFVSNLLLQVFLIMTIPIMVIRKRSIVTALAKSVYMGLRKFFTIISIISLPFLAYLPMIILKSGAAQIADKTFPEVVLIITAIGILVSVFVDCFIYLSVSQFLLDTDSQAGIKK